MGKSQELALFSAMVAARVPNVRGQEYVLADDCFKLWGAARSLHTLAEVDCNRGLTDAEGARVVKLEGRVSDILARWGLSARFNGDPRGFSVYVNGLGASNSWGGDGWGIG